VQASKRSSRIYAAVYLMGLESLLINTAVQPDAKAFKQPDGKPYYVINATKHQVLDLLFRDSQTEHLDGKNARLVSY